MFRRFQYEYNMDYVSIDDYLRGGPKRSKGRGGCLMMFFTRIMLDHVLKFTGKQVQWSQLFPSKHNTSFQRL